jgi:hypothetical protein
VIYTSIKKLRIFIGIHIYQHKYNGQEMQVRSLIMLPGVGNVKCRFILFERG